MKNLIAGVFALTLTPVAHAQVKADEDHVFGADPGWQKFREIAEAGVAGRLIDPESARITWSSGYRKGVFKPFLSSRVYGYVACGRVNARNRMGGYVGASTFVVVVDFGRTIAVEIDKHSAGMNSAFCDKQVADGLFPAVPTASADNSVTSGSSSGTAPPMLPAGISVRPMPEGAYVSAVEPNSRAASAGISAGMVITSVNAIPLAGMGDAMVKVLAASSADATLTIVGGKTIKLGTPK